MGAASPERETRGQSQAAQIVLIVLGVVLVLAALPFLFMGSMMAGMMSGMMGYGFGMGWGTFGFGLLLGRSVWSCSCSGCVRAGRDGSTGLCLEVHPAPLATWPARIRPSGPVGFGISKPRPTIGRWGSARSSCSGMAEPGCARGP
jgi:hypothetical protein